MAQFAAPPRAPTLESLGLSRDRPLVIVDVDEVLGLFMMGFGAFIAERGYELRFERFALFQNIYRPGAVEHLHLQRAGFGASALGRLLAGRCRPYGRYDDVDGPGILQRGK